MKHQFVLTLSIILLLSLALVAGAQAQSELYATGVLATYSVVNNPEYAVGAPDGQYAELVGENSSTGGYHTAFLYLSMGQPACGPLYVYAPADSSEFWVLVWTDELSVGLDPLNQPRPEGYGEISLDMASYDPENGRWAITLWDTNSYYPNLLPFEGGFQTVMITQNGAELPPQQVDAVAGTPCATVPQPEFGGFLSPIAGGDVLNEAKAGSAVPINFSLGGDFGLDVLQSTSTQVTCEGEAVNPEVITTVSAGASGLSYDPDTGLYTYVWKTDKGWTGTCRELSLTIGSKTYTADFTFK